MSKVNSTAKIVMKFRIPVYVISGVCIIILISSFTAFETGYMGYFLYERINTIEYLFGDMFGLEDEDYEGMKKGYWGWYGVPVLLYGLTPIMCWLYSIMGLVIIEQIKLKRLKTNE